MYLQSESVGLYLAVPFTNNCVSICYLEYLLVQEPHSERKHDVDCEVEQLVYGIEYEC